MRWRWHSAAFVLAGAAAALGCRPRAEEAPPRPLAAEVEAVLEPEPEPEPEPKAGPRASEPPLPPGALRRLGSGLLPQWDPPHVLGVGCDGACMVSLGFEYEARWDADSGELLSIYRSGGIPEGRIVDGETRGVDEDGCLSHGSETIGCVPEEGDPVALQCELDPQRIADDREACERDEFCDGPDYDEEMPLRRSDAVAAARAPRVLASFRCFDEAEHRLGLFDVAEERRLPLASLARVGKRHFDRGDALAISDDGRRIAFTEDYAWVVVDVEADRVLWRLPQGMGFGTARFSPDGNLLVFTQSHEAKVVSIPERAVVYQSPRAKAKCYDRERAEYVHNTFVDFLPDRRLLAYSIDGRLRIVSIDDGATELEIAVCATSAGLTADGAHLLVGTQESTEPLRYRLPSIEPLPPVLAEAPPRTAKDVDISADGRIAAAMFGPSEAWLWDVGTGKVLHRLFKSNGGIQIAARVTLSPDGTRLASGLRVGSLWNVETGEMLAELDTDHHSFFNDRFVFSPDGRTLTAVTTKAIRLWDGRSGELRHEVVLPDAEAYDLAFLDDERIVAVEHEQAYLVDVAAGAVLDTASLSDAVCPMNHWGTRTLRIRIRGATVVVAGCKDGGFDRIEVVDDRLQVVPTTAPPVRARAPVHPAAVAPKASLAVTRDPASTAVLVWPYPWPVEGG